MIRTGWRVSDDGQHVELVGSAGNVVECHEADIVDMRTADLGARAEGAARIRTAQGCLIVRTPATDYLGWAATVADRMRRDGWPV